MLLRILQNLQENICARLSFSIKAQAGGLRLHHIDTWVQVFLCKFYDIFKRAYFINVCGQLLLKSKSLLLESLFVRLQVFTINRRENCFTVEELRNIFPLKIPESLNKFIFQNSFEWLLFKILQETKTSSKSTTKKTLEQLQLTPSGCL